MTGKSAFHKDEVLFRHYFYDFQVLDLHTRYTHVTGRTLTAPYAGRIRRCTT